MAGTFLRIKLSERRFGQLMVAFVGLGFLALLAAGAAAGFVMSLNQDRTYWLTHTYEVERRINAFRIQIERLEAARRGYVIDQNVSFLKVYWDAAGAIPGDLAKLGHLTSDNPVQQARIAKLRSQVSLIQSKLGASMSDAATGQHEKALNDFRTDGSVELARQIRQTTTVMLADENGLLASRAAALGRTGRAFFILLTVCGALLLIMAAASILVILRYTRELAGSRDRLKDLNDNLEDAVEARTAELQRANDEIQRFAYIVSHDLRSPLVNVLGFNSELEAAAKPIAALIERAEAEAPQILTEEVRRAVREDIPEAIGFIRTSTQKMDRLINAILKLSREGRRTITPEQLNMDDLVQGAADSLQHRVAEIGAEITVEKPLPPLRSDRVAVEQILSNLIENAVKYLKPGRPGHIRISGRLTSGRVVYEVADNGRGIDPKDHERVFDLFRRSGAQDQPGEGIGLAHVRALAYRLGGIVSCESALDQGATFRLSLPAIHPGET